MSKVYLAGLPDKLMNLAFVPSNATGTLCHIREEKSWLNNFWTYPLHGAVSVLTIAAAPIYLAISWIVALILIPAPLCGLGDFSWEWYSENVVENLGSMIVSLIVPFILLCGIISPTDGRKKNSGQPSVAPQNGSPVEVLEG